MGNGNFCISVKDYMLERNDTLQNPIDIENGLFPNNHNKCNSSYYNNSQSNIPQHYSNYIITNLIISLNFTFI